MSITKITLIEKQGETVLNARLLQIRPAAQGDAAIKITVKDTHNTVEIASPYFDDLLSAAASQATATKHISTINSIPPTKDGAFFILGSACDSVDSTGSCITLTDLCPACTNCKTAVRQQRILEYYKIWLNAFKDVNLYLTPVVSARTEYLKSKRCTFDADSACDKVIQDMDKKFSLVPDLQGLRLLQQYVTTVHMWNYVVSQNNASTQIVLAPLDNTGLVVQTKRAIPSCGCAVSVMCQIRVLAVAGKCQDSLSVYVPLPLSEFKPFEGVTPPLLCIVHLSATTKIVKYKEETKVSVAGTFLITAKFLPFIYTQMTDLNGKVFNISTYTWLTLLQLQSTQEQGKTTKTTLGMKITKEVRVIASPTAQDYRSAKTYPSKSATDTNLWKVTITWTVTQTTGTPQLFKETLYYLTNGVRTYFDDIFILDELAKIKDGGLY